ncbi:hypothetical protein BRPE64_DCDS04420 (plasmid) [Caballeronia insecticola]|uniref:Uncharacterized protein n=1 Tax=Caballeronia insecticola TaxID=758793 RepID=R4WRU7_9BURK|nr:hypothetical protein BRPE64_DCDS04420 [Caballeronia insecticola]
MRFLEISGAQQRKFHRDYAGFERAATGHKKRLNSRRPSYIGDTE